MMNIGFIIARNAKQTFANLVLEKLIRKKPTLLIGRLGRK